VKRNGWRSIKSFLSKQICPSRLKPRSSCPALEPSAQGRHGPVGAGPEEGHKNDQRDGTPFL